MLANAKYVYALDMWTVEKRPNGWYFSKSAYHGDKHEWRGPYSSEMSVTLMIARELRKEIKKSISCIRVPAIYAFRDMPRPVPPANQFPGVQWLIAKLLRIPPILPQRDTL